MVNEFKIKQEICEVGRKIYAKGFAAANDGNISYRISDSEVLCTPTMVSKGFLKPDDICTVNMAGKQIAGRKKRTSEVLLHLEIFQMAPEVRGIVHCHPPHATAFSVAGVEIPTCILPEVEVFLGTIPTAEYETPGGQNFADTIRPYVGKAKVAVLKNHGTIAWGETVDLAYWWTEILDAYCRILMLANGLGNVERISEPKVEELLDLKEEFGMGVDPRRLENADLCVNQDFGRGFISRGCGCASPEPEGPMTPPDPLRKESPSPANVDRIVQEITDRIMASLT